MQSSLHHQSDLWLHGIRQKVAHFLHQFLNLWKRWLILQQGLDVLDDSLADEAGVTTLT